MNKGNVNKFSNLDKLYWKKEKISKGSLIDYYEAIAPYILPYLKNRPLVMHRFPEGIEGEEFYQKQAGNNLPSFVKTAVVQHKGKKISYIVIQNIKTLLYVVNLGSIELHPFNSSLKSLDKPDYIALDLDPEGISFDAVVDVAQEIHALLDEIDLPHFCKTSGGRGLHIYIPLHAKYEYELAKKFAYLLAKLVHERLPRITSLERNPKNRQKKVYIDHMQNQRGQTLVCPYSVRGFPSAPVSSPLLWSEVRRGLNPKQFTIQTMPKRLAEKEDVFEGVLGRGISLEKSLKLLQNFTKSRLGKIRWKRSL